MNYSTLLAPAVTVLVFAFGAIGVWLRRRALRRHEARTTSGATATSDAATLWKQSQFYTASLTADNERLTRQRDALLQAQSSMVLPLMTAINEALKRSTEGDALTTAQISRIAKDVSELLTLVKRRPHDG